jgi:acetylornithine/N-succinyldiaminopimelate aminotransferase
LQVLLEDKLIDGVFEKEKLFRSLLTHSSIKNISSAGLMMAVEFDSFETNKKIIDTLIEQGVFTDWFLFCAHAFRICPPLNISEGEIRKACTIILQVLENK